MVRDLRQRYASPTQPYSILIAATWKVRAATRPWKRYPPEDSWRQNDVFTAPDHSNWTVTSMVLPHGQSAQQWMARFAKASPGSSDSAVCTLPLSTYRHITVDGHGAWVHGAVDVCNFTEALVPVGDRVFKFDAHPSMATVDDHVYPPQMFRAVLASVKFTNGH